MKNPEEEDVPGTQEGGENTGCGDSTTSTATNSSGIGSGMSIKSSENSDTMSVSSGGTVQPTVRILQLSRRSEWMLLEQLLRTTEKGHPDLNQVDEVRT